MDKEWRWPRSASWMDLLLKCVLFLSPVFWVCFYHSRIFFPLSLYVFLPFLLSEYFSRRCGGWGVLIAVTVRGGARRRCTTAGLRFCGWSLTVTGSTRDDGAARDDGMARGSRRWCGVWGIQQRVSSRYDILRRSSEALRGGGVEVMCTAVMICFSQEMKEGGRREKGGAISVTWLSKWVF